MASRVIPPLASYADKPSTVTQLRFTAWLLEQTGVDPARMTPQQAFERGVALSLVLRPSFQQSPENQAHLEERRKERQREMAGRRERRAEREQAEDDIAAQVPEPVSESPPAPPARARRRGGSRASRAAAKVAEPVPAAAAENGDDPFADDPFGDDPEPAGTPEDPIIPAEIDSSDPPGSLWLGGPRAAAKGEPGEWGPRGAEARALVTLSGGTAAEIRDGGSTLFHP